MKKNNIKFFIDEIKNITNDYYSFNIDYNKIKLKTGLNYYNSLIIKNVKKKHGIYIWEKLCSKEIIYIGMAGKMSQNGILKKHNVNQRLRAFRKFDKIKNLNITTNAYLKNVMHDENCINLRIHVFHLIEGQLNSFVEAILINKFYQNEKKLPKYNKSF